MRLPGEWDGAKLDLLLETLKRRVSRGCASTNAREREDAEVLGYWYYQLKDCHKEHSASKKRQPRKRPDLIASMYPKGEIKPMGGFIP